MKKINLIILSGIFVFTLFFSSCKSNKIDISEQPTTEDEMTASPVIFETNESFTSGETNEMQEPSLYNPNGNNTTISDITETVETSGFEASNSSEENPTDVTGQVFEDETYKEPEISPEMQQYIDEYNAKEQDIYSRADNNTPPDQLITKSYPASEIINDYSGYFSARTYSGNKYPLTFVDEHYPIECLRDMGDGSYYAVYNIKEGGRWIMFFPSDVNNYFSYSLYLRAPLDKSRFEKLKPGDTLASVVDVDSSLKITFEKNLDFLCNVASGNSPNIFGTYHFFNDSLLFVKYENLNNEDVTTETFKTKKVKILEIKKFDDKKLVVDWEFLREDEIYADSANGIYDFNILPIDYP